MATNKIQVTLEVDDKGSVKLKQFGNEAENTKKKVDSISASASTGTSNMAAGFAKAAVGIAAATAALKTFEMVFQQAKIGEGLLKQEQAFSNLAKSAGTTSDKILEEMKKASKGMVDDANLIKAAGTSMMLGIPADKLTDLMQIAEATSRQTGQSVTEAFNDITLAVGRGSKMILDNLGIIVDVEKANESYAKSLGKSSDALSDNEKKQAFMNATLKAGGELVKKIGTDEDGLKGTTRLTTEWNNLLNNLAKDISSSTNPLFQAMSKVLKAINDEYDKGNKLIKERKDLIKESTDEELNDIIKNTPFMDAGKIRDAMREKKRRELTQRNLSEDPQIIAFQYQQRLRNAESENQRFLESKYKNAPRDTTASVEIFGQKTQEQIKADMDRIKDMMQGVYQRELELAGQVEAAEIAAIKKRYDAMLEAEELSSSQRLQINENLQKEITAIQRKYAQQRATQQSEFDQFYKGGSPSETRFMSNKTFTKSEDYMGLENYLKEQSRITTFADESARSWADYTGKKEDAYQADLRATQKWADEMENIYGETFDIINELGEEAVRDLYAKLGLTQEAIDKLMEEGKTSDIDILFQQRMAVNREKYKSEFEKWVKTAKDAGEQIDAVLIQAGESFASGFTDAFMEFADGTKSAEEAFKQFASTFLREIAKMIMQQLILNAIKSASAAFIGAADGGIFAGGFKAFADGGVVNQPTLGLVGEGSMNEAIVPLPDGRSIPVQMKGKSGDVNINVSVDGSKGGTRQENDRLGKQIARQVRDEVRLIIKDENRHGGVQSAYTYQRAY